MNKLIYVGAGHSNTDPGATVYPYTEAIIVTELRNIVAGEIRARYAMALTDGEDSDNLPLKDSIILANRCGQVRVELHLNSGPASAGGVECLSLSDQKLKAQAIARTISNVLEIRLRGENGWKSDSEGQHPRLAFCREGNGIVVECFFISNQVEFGVYQRKKYELAKTLAQTLISLN